MAHLTANDLRQLTQALEMLTEHEAPFSTSFLVFENAEVNVVYEADEFVLELA